MAQKPEHPTNLEITVLLGRITGHMYTFAVSSSRHWNNNKNIEQSNDGFYQLMPEGLDGGYWDWYCAHREYNQFFKSKADCALEFINYYYMWLDAGKPKPFDNF